MPDAPNHPRRIVWRDRSPAGVCQQAAGALRRGGEPLLQGVDPALVEMLAAALEHASGAARRSANARLAGMALQARMVDLAELLVRLDREQRVPA